MSTRGIASLDVQTLIKKLVIRRVEHRSEMYSNESHHLAEGIDVARLRRRFSFTLQQKLSFRTRHHPCRQGLALQDTRELCSQNPDYVHAHCTEGATRYEGREGANWDREGNGNGNGNEVGCGKGDENGNGVESREISEDESGDGAGTETELETIGRTPDRNRDGSGDENEGRGGDGNRDGINDGKENGSIDLSKGE